MPGNARRRSRKLLSYQVISAERQAKEFSPFCFE
jgi:hypothetical protein